MGIFDTITRGFSLTMASIRIVSKEPWMFILPIISGVFLAALLLGLLFTTILTGAVTGAGEEAGFVMFAAGSFVIYFIGYFLFYFSSAMVVFGAKERFEGRDPTIGQAFSASVGVLPKLLLLSVIGGTIGLITSVFSRRDARGNANIVGQIFAWIIGASWTVISYFALPVIVTENVGVIDSFKKSMGLVKNSWGEGMSASISLAFFTLPGIILAIIGIFLSGVLGVFGLVFVALGALLFMVGYVISIPVKAVISQALYVYATKGTVPTGFEADQIAGFYQKQ